MTKNLKLLIFLLTGFCFLSVSFPVLAEGILFFSPSRILLSDRDKVEVVNITNQSDFARAYKISTEDLVMTQAGVTASVETFEYSARRMIRFVPRQFTLKPGEKQAIRVMSRVRGDVPPGEYHTHLRFLEDITKRDELNPVPEGQAVIKAPMAYEALIPVIVSHGAVETTIGMRDVKALKDPRTGEDKISMMITRAGNGQGTAYIDTDYIAPDGSTSKATVRRTVYIYREIDERIKEYTFSLPEGSPVGGDLRISLYDRPDDSAQPVEQVTIPFSN